MHRVHGARREPSALLDEYLAMVPSKSPSLPVKRPRLSRYVAGAGLRVSRMQYMTKPGRLRDRGVPTVEHKLQRLTWPLMGQIAWGDHGCGSGRDPPESQDG